MVAVRQFRQQETILKIGFPRIVGVDASEVGAHGVDRPGVGASLVLVDLIRCNIPPAKATNMLPVCGTSVMDG